MKKVLPIILVFSIILCMFSACSSDGTGQQMVFPIDSEPKYLDPQIVSDRGAANIIANCFEGLVTYDENGALTPAGCEEYEVSPDNLTYTFTLRQDAEWMVTRSAKALFKEDEFEKFDTRVTASDYVFAFRRIADSATGSAAFSYISSIKNAVKIHSGKLSKENLGVYANGDYTLVIELEKSDPDFLFALTLPACVPCNETFFEMTKGRYCLSTSNIISNGPFYISNWADETAITARKSESYHSASSVAPSSVYFSFNNEKETRGEKVKSGVYELSPVSKAQAASLAGEKGISIKSFENSYFALLFNCSDELLKNADLRRALSSSLEKEYFLEDNSSAALGVIPPVSRAGGSDWRARAGTVTPSFSGTDDAKGYFSKAQAALNKSGVSLTVLCTEENELNVRKVMQNWQTVLGVKSSVTVEAVDASELEKRIKSGDFQLAFSTVLFDSDFALGALLRFSKSSGDNFAKLNSDRYESLLSAIQTAKTERESLTALKKAEQYLCDAAVFVPIRQENGFFAAAKGVSGIVFSPGGEDVYFKNAVRK